MLLFNKGKHYLCTRFKRSTGGYQSGQMGQTVNLLALAFGGSNPSPPTQFKFFRNFVHV